MDFFRFNYGIKNLRELIYRRNLQSTVYDAFYEVMIRSTARTPSGGVTKADFTHTPYSVCLTNGWKIAIFQVV